MKVNRAVLSVLILIWGAIHHGCISESPSNYSARNVSALVTCTSNLYTLPDASSKLLDDIESGASVIVYERYGDWSKVSFNGQTGFLPMDCVSSVNGMKFFFKEHAQILQQSGWFNYTNNLDRIEYFPWESFQTISGCAVGIFFRENGERIARIATRNRSDFDIVSTIVHESAHAEYASRAYFLFSTEAYAQQVENKFQQDYRRLIAGYTNNPPGHPRVIVTTTNNRMAITIRNK